MEISEKKIKHLLKCLDFEKNVHSFDFMKEQLRGPWGDDMGGEAVTYVCSICGATATYHEIDNRNVGRIGKLIFPETYRFLEGLVDE